MAQPPGDEAGSAVRALNSVLSEVIDLVGDVKQARRKVPGADPLHAELDALLDDLRQWSRQLLEEDEAEGVSPLETMPSVAGRTPVNLWAGHPSDDEVCQVVADHLQRLEQHVAAALGDEEGPARAVLEDVHKGVLTRVDSLRALGGGPR